MMMNFGGQQRRRVVTDNYSFNTNTTITISEPVKKVVEHVHAQLIPVVKFYRDFVVFLGILNLPIQERPMTMARGEIILQVIYA